MSMDGGQTFNPSHTSCSLSPGLDGEEASYVGYWDHTGVMLDSFNRDKVGIRKIHCIKLPQGDDGRGAYSTSDLSFKEELALGLRGCVPK